MTISGNISSQLALVIYMKYDDSANCKVFLGCNNKLALCVDFDLSLSSKN
jgi:hypothetical protein